MVLLYGANGAAAARVIPLEHPHVMAQDAVEPLGNGVWHITRRFRAKPGRSERVSGLILELESIYETRFMMIPAVSYDGNRWGDGKEPTGWEYGGEPWSFAWHRTSVAGGTFSSADGISTGLFAAEGNPGCGISCSLFIRGGHAVHRLILPEEEMPRSYPQKGRLDPGYRNSIMLAFGETVEIDAYAVIGEGDYRRFLDEAWKRNFHTVKPWFEPAQAWELGITYARESLWIEDGPYRAFSIGLVRDDAVGKWVHRPAWRYESGWCGQNISLGCSMLYDSLLRNEPESLRLGLEALDTWAGALLPSGLLCTQFDMLLGYMEMDEEPISACNLGGSAEAFLEAWELAGRCGTDRPAYLEAAKSILGILLKHQRKDGLFPQSFRSDGTPVCWEGFGGAFAIPALLRLYLLERDAPALDSAKRAFAYYSAKFHANGYTTAGALDSFCIDKESCSPLLSAALGLHRLTNEQAYLSDAEDFASYLSTWQWHHTVPFPGDSALGRLGYDTFGGTAVSTQHHHIDPYAVKYVPELLELAEHTGDRIWRERALAAWANGTIGISGGSLAVMGMARPKGSQDEAFFHTRWGNPFQVSQWLVAWPTAFRLEALRRTDLFGTMVMH